MELDLDKIKFEVEKFKKKHGVQKEISPEDAFMLKSIQPACHSKHITNEYFLVIELQYDGCTCGSDLPDARMPFTIVPQVNPDCYGFKAPKNWTPTKLGEFNLNLDVFKD